MIKFRKFEDRNFLVSYLVSVSLWFLIGYLLLATVVHVPFVMAYHAFLQERMPLTEWVGTFMFLELSTAMILSWIVVKRLVIPLLNRLLLGVR